MKWLDLGRKLQGLPKNFDTSKIYKGKDLVVPLKNEFLNIVREIDDNEVKYIMRRAGDPEIKTKHDLISNLSTLVDKLNNCIINAKFHIDKIVGEVDEILFKPNGKCNHEKDFCYKVPKGTNLYRMRREDNAYKRFDRNGLYVVREDMCYVVDDARFNNDGEAFLYLADSLYMAWEEMRRPDFHRANFVRFEPSRELKVLDLTVPDIPNSFYKLVRSYIALACGMKVESSRKEDSGAHKWQYEFSRIIAMRLHNKICEGVSDLSGIRYHSTCRFEEDFNIDNSNISMAYVFMPHDTITGDSDYCPKLARKFKMTEPTSYFFLKVHRQKFIPTTVPNTSEYQHTIFAELEEILKSQKATPCSELLKK